ncbi:CotY/CotZ family spore coat protein [Bacillus sp. B15-48]|uniref:CotY/CotZ family spore coat protein n=1 Tax=Bacillus sp. B15-48 TaxID=1548601 RepID=UPI00193FBA38|nr:CotY/CotZ family spore coat protein [Bacillus sp. B15-48]MBM4764264.1 spore coat protein CotZ [Bacillus sp. B15-48]
MGCGKKTGHAKNGCVCDVVRAILDIQENIQDDFSCGSNCFAEPLGAIRPQAKNKVNTRVFVLKDVDGTPFHAFFKGCEDACVSIYFRVEEVFDNCCATLRVLKPLGDDDYPVDLTGDKKDKCCIDLSKVCLVEDFEATHDCVTVDLSCFCAIQCIEDVYLDLC